MDTADHSRIDFADQKYLTDKIFYRKWANTSTPKAALLIIHGLGEHSGRYQAAAEFFCSHDVVVLCQDHLGHGLSPGRRGHIDKFGDYLQPIEELCDQLERDYPGIPYFILGHSMGGLIAANYLLDRQEYFAGAIFSGAALRLSETLPRLLRAAVDFLSATLPTVGIMNIEGAKVSRDPEVVNRYLNDPLVHHKAYSARLISELIKAMEDQRQNSQSISIPVLIMHGELDMLTNPEGSRNFMTKISSLDKTLIMFPGLYHEILNEPEGHQVIHTMMEWINQRVK